VANAYSILKERGFIEGCSDLHLEKILDEESVTLYAGFDPTSDSLHVGSLFVIMALAWFQRFGHRPIALVGGGTGLIGDPSGRTKERQLITLETVERNIAGIKGQLEKFLRFDEEGAILLDNGEWLRPYPLLDFLRDVGKHFRIGDMLGKESVRTRMEGEGISFTEFSYILLQSYDFYHLFSERRCLLQIGGSDQWGNITAGIDLIRRLTGEKAYGLTIPLIISSSGVKFGKTSEGQNVWLDPARTTPWEFYQFWINTDDRDVIRYLKYFTFLPLDEIGRLEACLKDSPAERAAQKALAWEVTSLVHGAGEAEKAKRSAQALFTRDKDAGDAIPPGVPSSVIDRARGAQGVPLVDLLVECGLASSKREARQTIQQGGIYLNSGRISDTARLVMESDFPNGKALVRKGKKDYHLFTLS
jgi:tyrosyl-tRNA synthetase